MLVIKTDGVGLFVLCLFIELWYSNTAVETNTGTVYMVTLFSGQAIQKLSVIRIYFPQENQNKK